MRTLWFHDDWSTNGAKIGQIERPRGVQSKPCPRKSSGTETGSHFATLLHQSRVEVRFWIVQETKILPSYAGHFSSCLSMLA